MLIECEALRQAIAAGDEAWENGILATHYRLGKLDARLKEAADEVLETWEAANQEFHDALAWRVGEEGRGVGVGRWWQALHNEARS